MATGEDLDDGINTTTPQFSETAYEIPSWQTPWNRPWYQRFDKHGKNKAKQTYNYVNRSKGHDLNCKCARCEEELDTAFLPQLNNSTNFIHVSNKPDGEEENKNHVRQEILDTTAGSFTSINNQGSSNDKDDNGGTRSHSVRTEKVILLSDLEEVQPSASTDNNTGNSRATSELPRRNNSAGNASDDSFNTNGSMSSINTDSLFNSFGSFAALQSISDRSKAIQEKIEKFRPETDDGRDSLILRGLLVSCLAELQRLRSREIEWLQTAANMVKVAIEDMLEKLEEKIRNNPHCQADNY